MSDKTDLHLMMGGMKRIRDFIIFIPLLVTIFLDSLGIGIVYPVFATVFGGGSGFFGHIDKSLANLFYGLTLGAFPIAMIIGAPILGDMSDNIGRKKVLLFSLWGEALGMLLLAFALYLRNPILLIFGRAFTGLLAGSIGLAQAAIIDISPEKQKTVNLSLISLASSLGFTTGPWIGGVLAGKSLFYYLGYSAPFLFSAILAFANGFLLIRCFTETSMHKKGGKISIFKGIVLFKEGFADPRFRKISVILFMIQISYCMFFQTTALSLSENFHYTASQLGHYFSLIALISAITLLVLIRIAVKFLSFNQILVMSLLLAAFGYALGIGVTEPLIWISAIPTPIGIGLGYMTLITMYSNLANIHSQGWAMGVATSMSGAGWGLGAIISGSLSSISFHLVYIVALAIILMAFILLTEVYKKIRPF